MGNLILCSGKKANHPFYFRLTDTKVYTIEELCYYIYENIYVISDELYQYDLVEWLKNEVGMEEISNKLKELIDKKNSLKDIVVSILCSADYYTEKEIKDLIQVIDEIELLSPIRKQKIKADNFLKFHNFKQAMIQYKQVLSSKDAAAFTKEEYGDIEHNLGIVFLHTSSYQDAAEHFINAYLRNNNIESLKQYLYALKLSEADEEIEKAKSLYNISEELIESVNITFANAMGKACKHPEYMEIDKLIQWKESGKVKEYYEGMDAILKGYKNEYRKYQ